MGSTDTKTPSPILISTDTLFSTFQESVASLPTFTFDGVNLNSSIVAAGNVVVVGVVVVEVVVTFASFAVVAAPVVVVVVEAVVVVAVAGATVSSVSTSPKSAPIVPRVTIASSKIATIVRLLDHRWNRFFNQPSCGP